MDLAIGVDPTKDTAATSSWARRCWTVAASPWTTLNTPSGSPASRQIDARITAADGSFSLGFSTKAFPAAMAFAAIHSGTMAGKLNGVMPTTTPRGRLLEWTSTPLATSAENEPFRCSTSPQAYSTFSRPRANSPCASDRTLPCSVLMTSTSSSARWRRRCRKAKSTSVRFDSDVAPQISAAAAARATTASTVAASAKGTVPMTAPVAGLVMAPSPCALPSNGWPLRTWWTVYMGPPRRTDAA